MRVSSDVVAPGDTVELTFLDGTQRGIGFSLERQSGSEWVQEFWLTSDRDEVAPASARVGEPIGWDDIGIGGPGPDLVEIPDRASPGRYRICTDQPEPLCVEIDIVKT